MQSFFAGLGDDSNDAFILAASTEEDRNMWIKDIRMVVYYDRGGGLFVW